MEKKKPTIDEIYKINVDGLFESTANWFDNAFKKSQAEINRDLYNKINGYSSSSESTGGNVNLGPLLTSLNGSNLYPSRGYLYYNGTDWEFNTPTVSGGGGGIDGSIVITKGSHSFTIELDDNGNLKFNGNIYATGGITAFGSSGGTSGGGSGGNTTGILYFGAPNKNLGFNGSKDMSLAFGDGLKVEKLDNQITVSAIGGGIGGGSIQVTDVSDSGESNNWISATKLRFRSVAGTKPTIREIPSESCVDVGIPTGGGSSSSGTTSGKLYFRKNTESDREAYWNGESNFRIIFGSGLNVSWDSTTQITLSATGGSGGSGGGSTSTSVSWEDVTNKPSTFTPSSHTHSTSDISGLSSYVQGTKVSNATNADRLLTSRAIWGQSFNGTGNINGNLYMGSAGGGSIQLYMNDGNILDRTNNTLHIGYGLKGLSDGEIDLDAYRTVVYTDNMSKHYDFKSNVFDVNSNQIHFGSETNGGKISWDAANNAFKIEGNVYATGGITALGVSNNATTSNNVDFTFRSVTANTFNVMDSIQLSDGLKLNRNGDDIILVNINSNVDPSLYLGDAQDYYIDANGVGYFKRLSCITLDVPGGARDFHIVDAGVTTFTIQFEYNGKTYQFTPSGGSVTVS